MSTLTTNGAASRCTCKSSRDHCDYCAGLEAAAKARPAPQPRPASPAPAPSERASPRLIDVKEVARLCSFGKRTVWRLVGLGRFPQPVRFSAKLVRWNRADVLGWIERQADDAQSA